MDARLDGRTALVTGSSRGIGLAIARAFAANGARVMLTSRKAEALEAARICIVDEVPDADIAWTVANAGDEDAAERAIGATIERWDGIDILVNNAATNPYLGPTLRIDRSRFDKTVEVNCWGPLLWTRLAVDAGLGAKFQGSVINVASIGALSVEPSIGVYNATKSALIHLTRTLAKELSPSVRVNAVAPGLVKTDMARALWEPAEERLAAAVPLQRLGVPDDIAGAALYLASDLSSWTTGTTVVVDGGMLL